MKKTLCILLTVVMLVGMLPVSAFAANDAALSAQSVTPGNPGTHTLTALDETKAADGYVCRIGDGTSESTTTYYSTVAAAAAAVTSGGTVTMIQDCTDDDGDSVSGANEWGLSNSTASQGVVPSKPFTLEGNGFAVAGVDHYTFYNDGGISLTVRNFTLTAKRVIRVTATSTTTPTEIKFENCTLYSTANHTIYLRGDVAASIYHTLTLDNCVATAMKTASAADTAVIFTLGGHASPWEITVNDSILNNEQTNGTASNHSAVMKIRTDTTIVNLTGNTVLNMASNAVSNEGVFFLSSVTTGELNIDDTVVFNANLPDGVALTSKYFRNDAGTKVTVNDKGATYTANANAAVNGVIVPPYAPAKSGYLFAGWTTSATATTYTAAGETYTGTGAVTFYPYYTEAPTNDAEAVAQGNVAKTDVNGDGTFEYHKTFEAAVSALPSVTQLDGLTDADKAKQTVILINDITSDSQWKSSSGSYFRSYKAIIFDGNDKSVTLTSAVYTPFDVSGADLYVNNLTLSSMRLARVWADADDVDVNVTNCNIDAYGVMGLYLTSVTSASGNGTVTVDSSVIKTTATADGNNASPIFTHYSGQCGKVNWTINVNDSILTQAGAITSTDAVIAAQTGENLIVNLTGNTVLNLEGTATNKTHYGVYVSSAHSDNEVNINVASTVKFVADLPDTTVNPTEFIAGPENTVVNNEGQFIANANAIKNGVTLPTYAVAEDSTFIGWKLGDDIIKAGYSYKTDDVTGLATFAVVSYSASDFDMIDGASIRTKDGSGIRFSTTVSDELLTLLGDNVSFGTLIGNTALLGDGVAPTDMDLATTPVTVVNITQTKWDNDGNTFHAALIDIPDNANSYQVKLSGRAYMVIKYVNESVVFYTDFDSNNIRSMYDVAINLTDAGNGTEVTQQIIATVNSAS